MKKKLAMVCIGLCLMVLPVEQANAQIAIAEIIKAAITKVIKAVDLQVQRLQNKTIWLQNAQKTLENSMSKLKLTEIKNWVEKQRKQYDEYFQELWKVKAALASYQRIKEIIRHQIEMVNEYKSAWALFRQDKNFTQAELNYILGTYTGILGESSKSIDQLVLVTKAFATQMSDAKRLDIVNVVADDITQQSSDLKQFSNQNKMISLQRAAEKGEIEYVKRLYGLSNK